jgi:hypothetical protein
MKSKNFKTRKNRSIKHSLEESVVLTFIQILNTVKIYHWKTRSYATHKATDELYSKLNEHIDSFVEVLLGKTGDRVILPVHTIPLKDFSSVSDFKKELVLFKKFLIGLNSDKAMKIMSNTDLYNIRDEILGDVNQFLYLLTFK